ncbi:MAG TPA: CDP-alcohol phosphatidyltransferase family protein [Polyangiaceae bacterium]|nr:CDP-alcohol phosphatidyltransferase family protein [Polyangiaceae bacterium]
MSDAPPPPERPAERSPGDLPHACVMLFALALTLLAAERRLLVGVAWPAFARLVWRGRASWRPIRFGVPNAVTVLRLGLITALVLGSTVYEGGALAALGLAVYALDGLDGQIARRFGLATEFGAEFDTEADAFYIAALSLGLWARGVADAWVLLPGLLRYLYVITVTLFRWRGEAPREKFSRYSFSITAVLLSLAYYPSAAAPWAAMAGTLVVSTAFWNSWRWAARPGPAPAG